MGRTDMDFYALTAIKFALGILMMIFQINILGKRDFSVNTPLNQVQNYVLGGIIGALVAIGNFAGICIVVQKVIDEPDEKKRKAQLQISYNTRMLLQALWIIIAIAAPCFQAFAGVLPLLFPRVTIYYLQITGKYKPLTPPQEPVDIAVEDDPAPAKESAVQPRDEGGEQE